MVVALGGHVGPDARRDHVVDGADQVDLHADSLQHPARDRQQPVGLARLGRALERAVEHDGPEVVIGRGGRVGLLVDEALDGGRDRHAAESRGNGQRYTDDGALTLA